MITFILTIRKIRMVQQECSREVSRNYPKPIEFERFKNRQTLKTQ